MVLVLDAAETILYATPALERVLGYAPEELIGANTLEFVHADDVERVARFLAVQMATPGIAPPIEMRFREAQGGYRLLEVVGNNLMGDPRVGALVLNARDITEWDATRRALRESEQRYRAFVERSSEGIFRFELEPPVPTSLPIDDQITQWYECARLAEGNTALARMLGREAATDVIGMRLADMLPPDDPASWQFLRTFASAGFHVTDAQTRERNGDGSERWYRNNLLGVTDHGLMVRMWGLKRDVTHHEVADELVQQSESRLRRMLQQAPAILWTTDASLRFTSATGSGLSALGVEPQDLVGVPIGDRFRAIDRQLDVLEAHRAALRGESRQYEAEWAGRSFCVHVQPLRGEDGAVTGTIGVALDITGQRRLEQLSVQSQKMDAVGQLTGGIAHDFNNLLTVILTNAELLAADLPQNAPEAASDLGEIRGAAQRGSEIVKKLLGFGRREMLSLRAHRVNDILERGGETIRQLLPPGITVEMEAADPGLIVHADATAVEQMLVNLVTNARDAMPNGGTVTISARSLASAGHAAAVVEIAVADSGVGMTQDVLEHAFEPFFTTKAPGEGSGLGLAMIYGLVKQHGGTVELRSEPGAGTTAFLRLPLMHAGAVVSENGADRGPQHSNGGAGTVLVAEDETAIRAAARRLLEGNGYRVIEAADGAEALEQFQAHEQDVSLIICDVVMPRLGGPEVLDALRRRGKSVPFLFMSGHSGRGGAAADAVEPGIPFLHKPWTATELLGLVRRLVDVDPT